MRGQTAGQSRYVVSSDIRCAARLEEIYTIFEGTSEIQRLVIAGLSPACESADVSAGQSSVSGSSRCEPPSGSELPPLQSVHDWSDEELLASVGLVQQAISRTGVAQAAPGHQDWIAATISSGASSSMKCEAPSRISVWWFGKVRSKRSRCGVLKA